MVFGVMHGRPIAQGSSPCPFSLDATEDDLRGTVRGR
jgi:hypothetical protein